MFLRQISEEITSTISTAWYFTTKSGGIWFFLVCPALPINVWRRHLEWILTVQSLLNGGL